METETTSAHEIMTVQQLCEYLQCSIAEIPRLEDHHKLPYFLLGAKKKRYRKADVDAMIERLVQEQNAPVEVHHRALEILKGLNAPRRRAV